MAEVSTVPMTQGTRIFMVLVKYIRASKFWKVLT